MGSHHYEMQPPLSSLQCDMIATLSSTSPFVYLCSHSTPSWRSSFISSSLRWSSSSSFVLLLLSLMLLIFATPSHSQHLSPDSLAFGRVQVQFPDITPRLLMDTQYMTPGPDNAYILYQSTQPDSLTLNLTFLSNFSSVDTTKINTIGASILIGLANTTGTVPQAMDEKNITIAQYPDGYALITLTNLRAQMPYFIYIEHSYALNSPYCIVITADATKIIDSPNIFTALTFRQLPHAWSYTAPASLADASLPFTTNLRYTGLALQPQYDIRVGRGAFTYELEMELRRTSDCTKQNELLAEKGVTSLRAHWLRPNGVPNNYFNLTINSTYAPALRVQPPEDRYATPYGLVVDGLAQGSGYGALILFYPLFRVPQWTITFQFGGADTKLHDDFDYLTEEQYASQVTIYNFIISQQQSYFNFDLVVKHGGAGGSNLTWVSASTSGVTDPRAGDYASTTKVPFPLEDPVMKLNLVTSFGQNITWFFTRQASVPDVNVPPTLPVVNQTQVLQSYQVYQSDLVLASKNLVDGNTTDQFQTISQDGVSYVALQRFTSNHSITAAIPVSDFRSKTISVTVKPTVNNATLKRDVYMIATTPNPLGWVTPEPVVINNVAQPEMEVIPDSSAVSITLSDTEGQSLTNSQLNQGNLTKLTSYSYSVVQSYDTVDSCPAKSACVPQCRIYDPVTSQWILRDVSTQVVSTGTVKCSSSTPGTIALLRVKIVTRTDVTPEVDGSLRYGRAKNDMALAIALIVVGGLLFILMLVGFFLSFMRETRSMQAQINELKKAMMEGENEDSRDRDDSHSHGSDETGETAEMSFLPSPSVRSHHHQLSSRHSSDFILASPSAQISLLAPYSATGTGSAPHSLSSPLTASSPLTQPSSATSIDELPFPRVSQLAPQFRPLSDAQLAMQYGGGNHHHHHDATTSRITAILTTPRIVVQPEQEEERPQSNSREALI